MIGRQFLDITLARLRAFRRDDRGATAIIVGIAFPILVGGMADAAVRRAESHDGWFLLPMPPGAVAEAAARVTVPKTLPRPGIFWTSQGETTR